jgi:hypothetical protein
MPDETSKPPREIPPSLLDSVPPTPPEVLKRIGESQKEQQHYAAVGRVAAAWSYFEAVIDTEAINLADIEGRIGVCFTAQVAGSARKLDAYISLARELHDLPSKLIEDFDKFAKKTAGLSERRNRHVHDVWFFDHPNPPKRLEATARKLLRLEFIPAPVEKILELARDITSHAEEFDALIERVKAAPRALPETSPLK